MKWFDDIKKYYLFRALIKRYPLPIIALYMIDVGLSVEQVALVVMISTLISLVFEIPSGALADGIGHKRALVISMAGQAIAMGLFIGGSFWWILAASATYWGAGSLMTGTMQALFFERLKVLKRSDEHRKLDGRARSFSQGVGILFMATAGIAYIWQPWLPFVIGISQFILAGILISTFGKAGKVSAIKFDLDSLTMAQVRGALKIFKKQHAVFWVTIMGSFFISITYIFHNFDQIILEDLGFTAVIISFVYVGKRIIGMIVPLTAHRLQKIGINDAAIMSICIFAIAVGSVILGLVNSPWIFTVVLYVVMGSSILFGVVSNDFINQRVGGEARATLLSFGASAGGLVQFLATVSVTAILGLLPLQMTFATLGIFLVLVFLLIIFPMMRRVYRA